MYLSIRDPRQENFSEWSTSCYVKAEDTRYTRALYHCLGEGCGTITAYCDKAGEEPCRWPTALVL
jgi:hypothetical protein